MVGETVYGVLLSIRNRRFSPILAYHFQSSALFFHTDIRPPIPLEDGSPISMHPLGLATDVAGRLSLSLNSTKKKAEGSPNGTKVPVFVKSNAALLPRQMERALCIGRFFNSAGSFIDKRPLKTIYLEKLISCRRLCIGLFFAPGCRNLGGASFCAWFGEASSAT